MGNPFKKIINNANKSKKIYGNENETSETKSKKCPHCGAARPADTNLTTCDYCGHKFMDLEKEVRIDENENEKLNIKTFNFTNFQLYKLSTL